MPETEDARARRRPRPRPRSVLAVVVAVTLVAVGVTAFVHDAGDASAAATSPSARGSEPQVALLSGRGDQERPLLGATPDGASVVRSTVPLTLQCPTTEKPGCALSFIKNDVGWRIHPVYGYHSCHTGIDLRGGYGAKIHAAADGTVIRVIHGDPAYGNVTLIQHRDDIRTMYAHQSSIGVHVGEHVTAGEVIGRIGATGFATGPHLHFEVHVDRVPYDPDGWFGAKDRHPVGCFSGTKY